SVLRPDLIGTTEGRVRWVADRRSCSFGPELQGLQNHLVFSELCGKRMQNERDQKLGSLGRVRAMKTETIRSLIIVFVLVTLFGSLLIPAGQPHYRLKE